MDPNEHIPKFTYDLLEQLDEALPRLPLPSSEVAWGAMSEAKLRQLAFIAGQRALVDMLLDWQRETNGETDEDTDRGTGLVEEQDVYGRVLGLNSEHEGVASVSVARTNIGSVLDTDTDE